MKAKIRLNHLVAKMSGKNKFYKIAEVNNLGDGFGVFLDGRRLVTPAKKSLIVPNILLAQLIANEWNAQEKEINTATMPITRLINVAIDRTPLTRQEIIEEIKKYASTDLLCYRTSKPQILFETQNAQWDSEIAWINSKFDINFIAKADSLELFQSNETLNKIGEIANNYDDIHLTILVFITALAGSAILGIAAIENHLNEVEIFNKIRIEEDFNAKIWGYDEDDLLKAEGKKYDLKAAFAAIASLIS